VYPGFVPALPLASGSGVAIISVVVLASVLFLWWVLRSEAREDAAREPADEPAEHER
jgi:hypothetical protein